MSVSAKDTFIAARGIVVATAFVSLWIWLAVIVRQFDPGLAVRVPSWLRPAGFLMLAAGAVLAATCVVVFIARGKGTPAPFDPPRRFVATGPYRLSRNPMYAGAVAAILGSALIVGSPSIALLAFGFFALAHAFVLVYEE